MSRNLSERSGDGVAVSSNQKETNGNDYSESSIYRGKTGYEGPYGDSPPENQRLHQHEYFILMLNDNEGSTPTSVYEKECELYNLKTDYIEKLNSVRRKLNLTDIDDESVSSTYRAGSISETIDQTKIVENFNINKTQQENSPEFQANHLFPVSLNNFVTPNVNTLDIDYTPPKKKPCHRNKTPTLSQCVESTVPYHIKISLQERLFQNFAELENKSSYCSDLWRNKFMKNKKIQCSIECGIGELQKPFKKEVCVEVKNGEPKNLVPKVIIENFFSNPSSSVASSITLKKHETYLITQKSDVYQRVTTPSETTPKKISSFIEKKIIVPPNLLEETSEELYNTGTSSTTTILCNDTSFRLKKTTPKNIHIQTSLCEDIKKTNVRLHGGSEKEYKQYLANVQKPEWLRNYESSNNNFRKSGKSLRKITHCKNVPLGTKVLIDSPPPGSLENVYFYFSPDADYYSSNFNSNESIIKEASIINCWSTLVKWFVKIFRKIKYK